MIHGKIFSAKCLCKTNLQNVCSILYLETHGACKVRLHVICFCILFNVHAPCISLVCSNTYSKYPDLACTITSDGIILPIVTIRLDPIPLIVLL